MIHLRQPDSAGVAQQHRILLEPALNTHIRTETERDRVSMSPNSLRIRKQKCVHNNFLREMMETRPGTPRSPSLCTSSSPSHHPDKQQAIPQVLLCHPGGRPRSNSWNLTRPGPAPAITTQKELTEIEDPSLSLCLLKI